MVYMGSKRRIAKYILPIILQGRTEGQWYVEPFCGGCNSINKVTGNRIAADNNKYLISLYKALQEGWMPKEYYTKEEYHDVKDNMDKYTDYEVGYVGFVCSFSGKFFCGYADNKVKRKSGKTQDDQKEHRNNLLSNFDKTILYNHSSYQNLQIPPISIIYCDPPYSGTTGYKTGSFDHESFWQWCREKTAEGHRVFISEYNAPSDFKCVWEMGIKDTLSTKNTTVKIEKLFTLCDVKIEKTLFD